MARWSLKKRNPNTKIIEKSFNINEILAQILLNRRIYTRESLDNFLNPTLNKLNDISEMNGVKDAIKIIINSMKNNEKIVIYGDYDVDGVMSTTILYKGLKSIYPEIQYYIPNRELEGYGLNKNAIRNFKAEEIDLIITCDNGIASLEEIELTNNLKIKTIIIDHHEPYFIIDEKTETKVNVLPKATIIIDPKKDKCKYPFKMLCAASICYKFIKELYNYIDKDFIYTEEFLVLAMIATFCDIVDLVDENRIIAKQGLEILNNNKNINLGLKALLEEKNILDSTINNYTIGFILGPCINATGRLNEATIAVKLFTTSDKVLAKELAKNLSQLNEKRKSLTQLSINKTTEKIEELKINEHNVVVFYEEETHESLAGIVAGRLKDKYYKPVIVLTKGESLVKGSGRSIEGYNLFDELFKCKHLFERFGGHAMAAGLSLKEENIDSFRTLINKNCKLTEEDYQETIVVDMELKLDDVTFLLATEIETLEPYGKGNKTPIFGTKNILPKELRVIENKNTIIFTFETEKQNRNIKGIYFGDVKVFENKILEIYEEYETNKILNGILRNNNFYMDIVYSININEFRDNISVQLLIKDFRVYK